MTFVVWFDCLSLWTAFELISDYEGRSLDEYTLLGSIIQGMKSNEYPPSKPSLPPELMSPAVVSTRVLDEVLLMVIFSFEPFRSGSDFRDDLLST